MIPVNNIQYIKASDIERELGIECWRLPFVEYIENAEFVYLNCDNDRLGSLIENREYWRDHVYFSIFNDEIRLVNYVREHFSERGILIHFD